MSQSGVETSDLQLTRSQSLPSLVIDKEPSVAISADYLDDVGSQTARHVASGSASGMIGSAAGIALTTKNQLWQIQRVASDIREKGHNAQSHREKISYLLGAAQIAVSALEWYAQMPSKPQLPRLLGLVLRELEVASTLINLYGFHSKLKKAATVFQRNIVQQKFSKVTKNLQDISNEIWQVREVEVQSLGQGQSIPSDGGLTPTPRGGSYAGSERGGADDSLNAKLVASRRIHRGKYGNLMKKWLGSKPSVTAMVYIPPEDEGFEEGGVLGSIWWAQDHNLFVHDLSDDNTKELERQQDVNGVIQCMHVDQWRGYVWMGTSEGNVMIYHDMRGEPITQQLRLTKVGVSSISVEQKEQVIFGFIGCQNGAIYSVRLDQAPSRSKSSYSLVLNLGQQLSNQKFQLYEGRSKQPSPMPSEGLEEFVRQTAPKNKKALYNKQQSGTSSRLGYDDSDSQSEMVMATEEEYDTVEHEEIPDVNEEELGQGSGSSLQAHKGQVHCIMYVRGKLWTSAGIATTGTCIRLWQDVSRNPYEMSFRVLSSWDCHSVGPARCMCTLKWPPKPVTYSASTTNDKRAQGKLYEVTDRVLSGHENGQILVWNIANDGITSQTSFRPILKVGQPSSPIRGLITLEHLGVVCAGHADGELKLRRFSSSMDKYSPGGKKGTSCQQDNKVTVIHPRVSQIQVHRNGMALCVGGGDMVITAGWFGSVRHFPEVYLRNELDKAKINIIPAASPPQQTVSMKDISHLLRHMNPDERDMVATAVRDAKRKASGSYSDDGSKGKPATGYYRPSLNTVNSNLELKDHVLIHASSTPNIPRTPSPRSTRSMTPQGLGRVKRGSEPIMNGQSLFSSQKSVDSNQGSLSYENNSQHQQDMDAAFSEFLIDYAEIKIQNELGTGSFGRVHKAVYNETTVAVKILQTPLIGDSQAANDSGKDNGMLRDDEPIYNLKREVGVLYKIRHPNVVNFMGLCLSPPCVITEFCDRGSLFDVLKDCRESNNSSKATNKILLGWVRRLQMLLDAAIGMLNLHKHKPPIVHRDLKSPNLLVTKDWTVKVADFNLSRFLDSSIVVSKFTANNPLWQAPEVIKGGRYTKQSDVYAFGIIMWEVMTVQPPWGEDVNFFAVMQSLIEQDARPLVQDDFIVGTHWAGIEDYKQLMAECWDTEPQKRPSFSDIAKRLKDLLARAEQAERDGTISQRLESQFPVDKFCSFNTTMSYSARRYNIYDSDVQVGSSPFGGNVPLRSQRYQYVGPQVADVIKEMDEFPISQDDGSSFFENSPFDQHGDVSMDFSPFEKMSNQNSGSVNATNSLHRSQDLTDGEIARAPDTDSVSIQEETIEEKNSISINSNNSNEQQIEDPVSIGDFSCGHGQNEDLSGNSQLQKISEQWEQIEFQSINNNNNNSNNIIGSGGNNQVGTQYEADMLKKDSLADLFFGGGPFGQQD